MTSQQRVFELRTYYATPGKLDELHDRFRDHTLELFVKHGIGIVGFWVEIGDDGRPSDKLVYLLSYPDLDAVDAAWSAFRADPEWVKAKATSEHDGPLTVAIESAFLTPADYSPIQ
jgi:hypothetical protein